MKLWLKRSIQRAQKRVGWITPGKRGEGHKGYVFFTDSSVEVPDAEAQLILSQNAHLVTNEQEIPDDPGDADITDDPTDPDDADETQEINDDVLDVLREASKIDDLDTVNAKRLRGWAKTLGKTVPPTVAKSVLIDVVSELCAEWAKKL